MYAISNVSRVYISLVLFLCSAFFSTAALAADGYWSTQERRFVSQAEVNRNVQRILDSAVSKPSGTTLGASPTASSAPIVTKNPLGGLSQTTQNTLRNMGQPSTFTSTLNNSVGSAKTALKSCVRSPACAGRALGAGAVIYEGIKGWQTVYEILYDEDTNQYTRIDRENPTIIAPDLPNPDRTATAFAFDIPIDDSCPSTYQGYTILKCVPYTDTHKRAIGCPPRQGEYNLAGFNGTNECQYARVPPLKEVYPEVPVTSFQLDDYIDQGYEPAVSDAPIVLLSGEPESITLSNPSSAELPSTTTTNTSSGGQTTTSVTNKTINYNVTNNNTSNPSINSELVETTTTYDTTGNLTNTSTSTTTANGVQPDVPSPSPSAPLDLELPAFCTWASIVCEWIGWTKEGIEGEEPDLINLISEFEPDDNQYNSGIGSGSCPAPMSIYLSLVKQTVEVSYQPFCDFLDMIRPLVIAGAWLLSAFMYVGVLRRG